MAKEMQANELGKRYDDTFLCINAHNKWWKSNKIGTQKTKYGRKIVPKIETWKQIH